MKQDENILDVLMYLFENYIDNEQDSNIELGYDAIREQLFNVGFSHNEISKAFTWLDDLTPQATDFDLNLVDRPQPAMRLYTADEKEKFPTECQGFLLFLQQLGIVNTEVREVVIERCMALESEQLSLDELKWVLLMVLFNDNDEPQAHAQMIWVEQLLYGETNMTLH